MYILIYIYNIYYISICIVKSPKKVQVKIAVNGSRVNSTCMEQVLKFHEVSGCGSQWKGKETSESLLPGTYVALRG